MPKLTLKPSAGIPEVQALQGYSEFRFQGGGAQGSRPALSGRGLSYKVGGLAGVGPHKSHSTCRSPPVSPPTGRELLHAESRDRGFQGTLEPES